MHFLRKDPALKLLCAVLLLVLAGALLLSDRYWVAANRPVVDDLAEVKVPPELGELISAIDAYGVHIQRVPSKAEQYVAIKRASYGLEAPAPSYANMSAPRFGYSVREATFLVQCRIWPCAVLPLGLGRGRRAAQRGRPCGAGQGQWP